MKNNKKLKKNQKNNKTKNAKPKYKLAKEYLFFLALVVQLLYYLYEYYHK